MAIIEGIVDLAKAFHRTVIAEEVEMIAHGQTQVQMDYRLGQGYGFARPMPAGDISDWINTWKANKQ